MRLDKFLTECGLGSRTEVKKIIKKGIRINGKIVKNGKFQLDEFNSEVEVDNKRVEYKKYRYYILNKPQGVITATEDAREKTVMDILPTDVIKKNLIPVGRLDKDTEGLLLLTNNGELAHNVLSPKKHVKKKYFVKCEKEVNLADIKLLENGVDIGNYITKPAKVELLNEKEINLEISEGKFHQIKRMLKAVDNEVIYLKRVEFGELKLKDFNLGLGEVVEVSEKDIIGKDIIEKEGE
ncbi:pseudouridine synthase [Haliovirga abyssi]|uniref:Pseudouridine synthase n=1 Tax=Haliovirga abyssi TaxID=2996794 RepID=A0AAU9DP76_9FUSO|nr:pseudouridine synthase [Haliovirga abyssi]BDU50203.1 pseudouridine synthase [Haliovirga abyssi]